MSTEYLEYIELVDSADVHPSAVNRFMQLVRDGKLEDVVASRQRLDEGPNDILKASSIFTDSINVSEGGRGVYTKTLNPELQGRLASNSWDLYREVEVRIPEDTEVILLTGGHSNGTISVQGMIVRRSEL